MPASAARAIVTKRGLRAIEDEADRVGAGVDGGVDVRARAVRPQILMRVRCVAVDRALRAQGSQSMAARSLGNRMGGIVVRADEVEPVGREGRRLRSARSRACQHLAEPVRRALPLPTAIRQPIDVADHVMQEGVGVEIETPVGAAARDVDGSAAS